MTEKKPNVSIILPSYNRAELIGRSIQSVLNQTYQNFEIIIVDDGSTDNTEKIIHEFTDYRIKYIKHEKKKGGAAARNTGLKNSNGQYIAFQDSDDEWMPTKLELQVKVLDNSSPNVGVVYTDMLRINKYNDIEYCQSPTTKYGSIINPKTLDYQLIGIGIQSTLIKKECFDDVGFFDEIFPRYIDLELFIRLIEKYDFHHIKEPLVKYWTTEGISSNKKAGPVARELLLKKHYHKICKNRKFLAKQYSMIGYAFLSVGMDNAGKKYSLNAFKTEPTNPKYLFIAGISICGQRVSILFTKCYEKLANVKKLNSVRR